MTKEKAEEWIENTFSEFTPEEDRQESIYYLIQKIYRDLEKEKENLWNYQSILKSYNNMKRNMGI